MRDLARLIAIGLLSFAIVGFAMLYSRSGDVTTVFRSVSEGVASAVDGIGSLTGAEDNGEARPQTFTLALERPRAAAWVGLAGFPDQSELVFRVPRGANYLSGALNLVFDTQLTEHGDGLLTLSVNGTPRGQLVLDSGRHTHRARIELTAADLSGDRLVLHMAGRGTTNSGQICPTDAANSGSAVTLTTDSRLELVSATAPSDTTGVLLASPGSLALQPGSNQGDMALAIWASQQLKRAGIDARLSPGGPGETSVLVTSHAVTVSASESEPRAMLAGEEAVMALVSAASPSLPLPISGPVTVADLGAETIIKSFRGSRRWTVPFNAADMPGGSLPETFALRLKATPLAAGNDWVVRVTLNGNLIETYRVAGSTDTLAFDVALPAERMLPSNTLMVELVDTTPNQGICTRPPDAQAQLLPESSLRDSAPATIAWAQLIERLAASPQIALDAEGLDLAQAGRASELLQLLLPRRTDMRFDGDAPVRLKAVTRNGAAAALALAGPSAELVMPVATNNGRSLAVVKPGTELGTALQHLGADDVVVIVTGR